MQRWLPCPWVSYRQEQPGDVEEALESVKYCEALAFILIFIVFVFVFVFAFVFVFGDV